MNNARNEFDAAKGLVQDTIRREILWPARVAGLKPDEAVLDLYYYDVGPKSAVRINDKFAALPESLRTPTLALAVARVISTGTALSIAVNAEAARKAAKACRSSDESGYSYPTSPETPATPEWRAAVKVGDYFLVRYGNGTQLAHVFAVSPVRLCVWRLVNRGSKWAHWRSSSIKRTDARILGPSRPVAGDPA